MVKSAPSPHKPSKVEGIKENSNFLREPVATEVLQDTTHFSEDAVHILKFHGSYQQDNRDHRTKGQEKDYQFMLRTKNPGGFIPPQLYLALDKLADEYGNQTLRATTRQGFQLHGILKQNLKTAIATIVYNLGSTLGACGDINRNVMAPPAPWKNRPEYQYAWEYAQNIADLLSPQTGAYYEIWLDGEMVISGEPNPQVKAAQQRNGNGTIYSNSEEPIYGNHYMPRKFKICVTVPGDNSVDLYSQDLTLVVITNNGNLEGFNFYAGGGLGRTHNKEETFARLADPIGYVAKDDVYDLVKAIVATQRDYGNRSDRRHARLKYLLHDWGVDKFRTQVEEYFGKPVAPFQPLPEFKYQDYLGWNEQGDGKLFLGISIENGRIRDEGSCQLKTALGKIVGHHSLPIRLTPNQNLIVYDITPEAQPEIQQLLVSHGVVTDPTQIEPLVRYAMACPALPTCGLAITESERIIPSILERIRTLLDKLGLQTEHFMVRMTGCPNGCARPYMAELGFVGNLPETYQVWLGGSPDQTRLAQVYTDKLHQNDLESFLEPIFLYFKQSRQNQESFGDFCYRVGLNAIREFTSTYEPLASNEKGKTRRRVSLRDETYVQIKAAAARQGKPMTELVNAAIAAYLQSLEWWYAWLVAIFDFGLGTSRN